MHINKRADVTMVAVQYLDPENLSRAYAFGPAGKEASVKALAAEHIVEYKKRSPMNTEYRELVTYFEDESFKHPRDAKGYLLKLNEWGAAVYPPTRA
jgi:hypothetical protein